MVTLVRRTMPVTRSAIAASTASSKLVWGKGTNCSLYVVRSGFTLARENGLANWLPSCLPLDSRLLCLSIAAMSDLFFSLSWCKTSAI